MKRKYLAEFIGTFAIVFFGCGAIMVTPSGSAASLTINTTFGLIVAAMVCALGHISAAHFNPAVTIAFAASRSFPWRYAPGYILSQVTGALLASGLHLWLLPAKGVAAAFGATTPTVGAASAVVAEVVLTFFLMLVIAAVATDRRVNSALPGFAIGAMVLLCGLVGGPVSGCSMNPARSLGPAFFAGGHPLGCLWIYFVGPMAGALLAVGVYELLRGDTASTKCALGVCELGQIIAQPGEVMALVRMLPKDASPVAK